MSATGANRDAAGPNELAGLFPFLVSPTTSAGTPDIAALEALVEYVVANEVDGITPLGSSGELPYLEVADRLRIIEAVVRATRGRVPVVAGVGGFSMASCIAQAKAAEEAGADAVLLMALAFSPLTDDEIARFTGSIIEAIDIPVVLYHNPALCRIVISSELMRTLVDRHGLRYVKDASGDLENIVRWLEAAGSRLQIFSATAVSPTAAMRAGCVGWMSGPATAFPRESVEIYRRCCAGSFLDAEAVESALDPALDIFRRFGPSRGAKALVRAAGLSVGEPLSPLAPLSNSELALARRCWEEVSDRLNELGAPRSVEQPRPARRIAPG